MKDEDYITSDFTEKKQSEKRQAAEKRFSPKALSEQHNTVNKNAETDALPKSANTLSELITTLKDVIMDDIDRVKKDREYVHQAKAVNNHVNSVINLARLQYDILRNKIG